MDNPLGVPTLHAPHAMATPVPLLLPIDIGSAPSNKSKTISFEALDDIAARRWIPDGFGKGYLVDIILVHCSVRYRHTN